MRMAVPFHAAQTPKERSEFAHPDVGILLTTLAYYHDGLSREEVVEALTKLLALGESARNDRYNDWYNLSQDGIKPGMSELGGLGAALFKQVQASTNEIIHIIYRYDVQLG